MQGDLDLYRTRHRELLAVAAGLAARADHGSLTSPAGSGQVRALLTELSGKLLVHLAMEDRSLYPHLLRSPEAEVRATAARFQEQLGSLRTAADAFFRRWLRPGALERAPDAFSAELRPLLHQLTERIAAEDAELFPLVERPR